MINLENRVALVTGGSRGIGRAICLKLAEFGADVAVNDVLPEESAKDTLKEVEKLGRKAVYFEADVSNTRQVKEMIERVVENFERIDILVNNAGVTRDGLLIRMKEEDWDKVIAVNLKGVFNLTQAVSRYMLKERKGAIVNISSVVGLYGNAGQANYSASKAGVIGLTKTSAKEFASRGIRVNAVAPGFIETEMTKRLSDDAREKIAEEVPLNRFGSPEDVASLVSFLVSDEASYITGEVVKIDGGLFM